MTVTSYGTEFNGARELSSNTESIIYEFNYLRREEKGLCSICGACWNRVAIPNVTQPYRSLHFISSASRAKVPLYRITSISEQFLTRNIQIRYGREGMEES
jgi:hypothetical protein